MLSYTITANGNTATQVLKPRVPEVARVVNLRAGGTFNGATIKVYSSFAGSANAPSPISLTTPVELGIQLMAGANVFLNTVNAGASTNVSVTIEG